jgi:alpha-tubulin suppressor-like RCC1 family protein
MRFWLRTATCGSFLLATLLLRPVAAQVIGNGFVDLAGARAVDLSVNIQGACAVTDGGRLVCWGNNSHGALGPVKKIDRLPPTVRPDVTDAVQVFLADSGGCVKHRSGAITCWGMMPGSAVEVFLGGSVPKRPTSFTVSRDHGCGIATGQVRCWGPPTYRVAVRNPVQVSAGPFRSCARDGRGAVWCWGGSGGRSETAPPLSGVLPASRVPGIAGAVDLSVSAGRSCVALRNGNVDCWLAQRQGEIKRARISGIDDAIAVSAAANHACAIRRGGGVACWGYDDVARPVPNLARVTQLVSGFSNTCARLETGSVLCLGSNASRELGVETQTESTTPVRVPGVEALAVAVGYTATCALGRDGGLVCWSEHKISTVGTTVLPEAIRPAPLPGARDVVQVVADERSICALSRAGRVTCWPTTLEAPLPAIERLQKETVRSIALGDGVICAVTVAGEVLCPDRVDAARGAVEAVGGNRRFGCARKPAGEVICWGSEIPWRETHRAGVPGWTADSIAVDPSPHIVRLPPVRQLAAGGSRLCGVFADDRVFCPVSASQWKYVSWPVPVVPIDPVRSIAVSGRVACAIFPSGRVGCWGNNDTGQLGIGRLGGEPAWERPPALVVGLDRVTSLSVGEYHVCAVRADHAVFCWGTNASGQLGLGTLGFRPTP